MKKVTLNTYRKDKYYSRVVRAVAKILLRSDVIAPVEVLLEMGNLNKKNLDAWRKGQVPYLERVFEGSLSKANRILRIIGFHVHDLNMVPKKTRHLRCDTLKDVGKFFGINKNSTISSVDRRLKREMIKDKQIKKNVEALKFELTKGQE